MRQPGRKALPFGPPITGSAPDKVHSVCCNRSRKRRWTRPAHRCPAHPWAAERCGRVLWFPGAASVCRVVMKKGVLEEPPIMLVYCPPPLRDTSPLPPFPLIRRQVNPHDLPVRPVDAGQVVQQGVNGFCGNRFRQLGKARLGLDLRQRCVHFLIVRIKILPQHTVWRRPTGLIDNVLYNSNSFLHFVAEITGRCAKRPCTSSAGQGKCCMPLCNRRNNFCTAEPGRRLHFLLRIQRESCTIKSDRDNEARKEAQKRWNMHCS